MNIFQIKITLLDTKPPIWRRLLVPVTITLEQLHEVLQVAMGWQNRHLYGFRIGRQRYVPPDDEEVRPDRSPQLKAVLGGAGEKAIYDYDFGDSWEHQITVEKILAAEPGRVYPTCVGGKMQCPPEDCGGIPGFYNLLDAIGDPSHPEHDELLEWVGEGFDPKEFSAEEVNFGLGALNRR